jgi:hypothetical protein
VDTNFSERNIASVHYPKDGNDDLFRSIASILAAYKTAQRNNPEDHIPQLHLLENLKSLSNFIIDTIHFWRFSAFTHFVASGSSTL